jgi:protein ImuB
VAIYCCLLDPDARPGALERVARACSPRVDPVTGTAVIFDASGLDRVIGSPEIVAQEVVRLASADGLHVQLALAASVTAAWVLAQACTGITVTVSRSPAEAIRHLPLRWLETLVDLDAQSTRRPPRAAASADPRRFLARAYADRCAILARWGLGTFGDLARLDPADVHARLGLSGVRLHQAARGEDACPLGPAPEPPQFVERIELEWPIDSLEPLAFVLARQTDTVCAALARADRGAAIVTTTFGLVTRDVHTRVLHLPTPIGDAAMLRTLLLLDLEAHPAPAAIDTIEIGVEPAPRSIVQRSLLDRVGTSPEEQATLIARLGALMGETRVGRPIVLDTHDARAVEIVSWPVGRKSPEPGNPGSRLRTPRFGGQALEPSNPGTLERACPVLRRFRLPMAARVTVSRGMPVHVTARGLGGGDVVGRAGPWRTSGRWWRGDQTWDRDEWDLELSDGGVYRLARDRATGVWVVEGVLD